MPLVPNCEHKMSCENRILTKRKILAFSSPLSRGPHVREAPASDTSACCLLALLVMIELLSARASHGPTVTAGIRDGFGFTCFRFVLTGIACCAQFRSRTLLSPVLPYEPLQDVTSDHYHITQYHRGLPSDTLNTSSAPHAVHSSPLAHVLLCQFSAPSH